MTARYLGSMPRVVRLLVPALTALVAIVACAAVAPAAEARSTWRAPCVPGAKRPLCTFWSAKVVFVADGDTIRVQLDGDPSRRIRTVRFTGINAMEMSRYSSYPNRWRGACHAIPATRLVYDAVRASRGKVWLAAQRPGSHSGVRLRRSVFARVGGRWQDLGRMEVERGLALWLPNGDEYAHNLEYRHLAQQAAAARRGLYNPTACGAGPDDDVPLGVVVNWDADGNDAQNLNGEWIEVSNHGSRDISLRGWWVRDSWLNYRGKVPGYPFPASARVPAGGAVRVHVGCGRDTATDLYWCQRTTAFENVTLDRRHMGDGAYLFDPQGDLRASMIYPCMEPCSDPLKGAVRLTVHPNTPEWIDVSNVSSAPFDLHGYLLKLHLNGSRDEFIWGLPFARGTLVGPGESLRLWLQGSPRLDTPLVRHLGMRDYVLTDGGNVVSLRSYDDAVVACAAWGRARC
jgi:endonuclease YncB( thermonuclease family)